MAVLYLDMITGEHQLLRLLNGARRIKDRTARATVDAATRMFFRAYGMK